MIGRYATWAASSLQRKPIPRTTRTPAPDVPTNGDTKVDRVIIMGAAGRDFHDFMTYWSRQPDTTVVCFTATQIPDIDHRSFPAELCHNALNHNRYPNGIPILPQDSLEDLIHQYGATTCALAYSDLSYDTVQSLASRVNAAGCRFVQLPPEWTMLRSQRRPVVAVCASRTGVGKSATTRYVAQFFKNQGLKVAVVRHPMPYGDLLQQRCQRFDKVEDMKTHRCTIEEEEEYFLHIQEGNLLFAGVDYEMILHEAEKEADLILWDGGNNDVPFFRPNLHITLVDSLRPSDEAHYYPGETNVRLADVVLITKVNDRERAMLHANHLKRTLVPASIPIFFGSTTISPQVEISLYPEHSSDAASLIRGKRVLVVDDGPTLTHGGMPYGVGYVMAEDLGAGEIVDPRPYAKGSLRMTFEKFTHLKNVLPAMGYGDDQILDLQATIQATPCDTVVLGTPSNFTSRVDVGSERSVVVARYHMQILPEHREDFHKLLTGAIDMFRGSA